MRGFVHRLAAAGAVLLLAGCGGGGSSAPANSKFPVTTPTQAPSAVTSATFSISIHPRLASGAQRKPAYLSPTIQSLTFQAVQANGVALTGQPVSTQNLAASAAGCSSNGATVTCSTNASAPSGNVIFAVNAYDQPDAAGNPTSTTYASATLAPNGRNQVVFASPGSSVASLTLIASAATFAPGTAASTRLFVEALDSTGAVIVGPYARPITITATSVPSGHGGLTLSGALSGTSEISTTPSDVLTLTYDGSPAATAILASASTMGASGPLTATTSVSVGTTSLVTSPGSASPYVQNAGFAFTALGQSGTLSLSGGTAPYTVSSSDPSIASVAISGSTVTVTSSKYGSANVIVTDATSTMTTFPVTVSAPPIAISAAGCSTSVVTCSSTGIQLTPGVQATPTVSLGLSGGSGTYSFTFASTGNASSACDSATLATSTIVVSATGVCSDLLVISSAGGTQTAYFPIIQQTGSASYTLGGTFHAYSPSANNVTIVQKGQATIVFTPGHGPWTQTNTCGTAMTTVINGDTAVISADASSTASCSITFITSAGKSITPIAITEVPPLTISGGNSFTLHALGDTQTVTVQNGTSTGLTLAAGSIELASGSTINLNSYTAATGALSFSAYMGTGTNLISIRDTNLDEKVGVAVTVDDQYASSLPASIGLINGAVSNVPTVSASVPIGSWATSVTTLTNLETATITGGTLNATPLTEGTDTLIVTDALGGTVMIPVAGFGITVGYPGSAIGATASEAFTAVGQTDAPPISGPAANVSFSSSNPAVVSASGTTLTAVAPGTATISLCYTAFTTPACAKFTASVTTTAIPILGKGHRVK